MLRATILLAACLSAADAFSLLPALRPASFAGRVPHCSVRMGATETLERKAASSSKKTAPVVADPAKIRNVAVVGHSHSGKTALTEWMLYDEKVITRKPVHGASTLDSDPEEMARKSSVFSHFARVPHRKCLIEIVDTPWGDFPCDANAALDGADSAIIVVSAADGVQSGATNAYQHCQAAGIRSIVALSKMDRPFLKIDEVLDQLEVAFGVRPLPLQVHDGEGEDFKGVQPVIVLDETGILKKNEKRGLEGAWGAVEEAVAMGDDELLAQYLDDAALNPEQVINGLRVGVREGRILPLVFTSAEKNLGVLELMDALVATMPNPLEAREQALKAAASLLDGRPGHTHPLPRIDAAFTARVLHTSVDSFGQLSVLRVIANSRDADQGPFHALPHETVNLRTGDKIKMPSTSNSFALCGKERLPLSNGGRVVPGDVIAVPKLPDTVRTNDILTLPSAAEEEQQEIELEEAARVLTPLSRAPEKVPLMAAATVSVAEAGAGAGGKKAKGKAGAGDDKLRSALEALAREDLALSVDRHDSSGSVVLRGVSWEHVELAAGRLEQRYGISVQLGRPPVQYRETLAKAVHDIEGKHKKQTGGAGQYGVCFISMEPLEEGSGVLFESKIKGGAIPKPFVASVEKGVRQQLEGGGPLGGFPVTDVKITLTDGKTHQTDSKDVAFQAAGRLAVKGALAKGGSVLLQPMDSVAFEIGEKHQGELSAIIARHGGFITDTAPEGGMVKAAAIIPTAAMPEVSDALRAVSAGEGTYTAVLSHYQPVPDAQVAHVIANAGSDS